MQIAAIRQKVAGTLRARHNRVDANGHGHSLKSFLRSELNCAKMRSGRLASGPSRPARAHYCPAITNHDLSRGNYPILCVWGTHMVDYPGPQISNIVPVTPKRRSLFAWLYVSRPSSSRRFTNSRMSTAQSRPTLFCSVTFRTTSPHLSIVRNHHESRQRTRSRRG